VRRLIALLSLLCLANLVFVRGGVTCPLTDHHSVTPTATLAGHEGHDMSAMAGHDMAQPAPDEPSSHAPACRTMGPCALALDIAGAVVVSLPTAHADGMVAASDHLPPSATRSPELPPPRA
jgi:hypothetical protein